MKNSPLRFYLVFPSNVCQPHYFDGRVVLCVRFCGLTKISSGLNHNEPYCGLS